MGIHPASRTHETQSRPDFRAAASFAAMVRNRSAAASPYFAPLPRIVAASARFFTAPSEHPTRALVPALSVKRARVQPWLATSVIEDGSVATDMPSRMLRKHRRLENHTWPHPEDSVVPSQAWPAAANPRKIHETQWRQPAIDDEVPTRSPQMRTVTHAQAEPVINVARITDEVIKQIDRRFIAARERRGKI